MQFLYLIIFCQKQIQTPEVQHYLMILNGILYLNQNKLLQFYPQINQTLILELQGGLKGMKALLKNYGETNVILWVTYADFEYRKSKSIYLILIYKIRTSHNLINYTYKFSTLQNRRKKDSYQYISRSLTICVQAISTSYHKQSKQILLKINFQGILLEQNFQQININILIMKIRSYYQTLSSVDKINNFDKLEKYKNKLNVLFPLSKKAILSIFMIMLETLQFGQIYVPCTEKLEGNLQALESDLKILKSMMFQDPHQKQSILSKYRNELSIILLNYLRFIAVSELHRDLKNMLLFPICQLALRSDNDQLIFFIEFINRAKLQVVQNLNLLYFIQALYFQKLEQIKCMLQRITDQQTPQKCWIIWCLIMELQMNKDPMQKYAKLQSLYELTKEQSEKKLSQIYCESEDQESFKGMVNISYNYYMDKIQLLIQKQINQEDSLIKSIYRSLKRHPYSIVQIQTFYLQDFYTMIIRESSLEERRETLNLLTDIEQKELKLFNIEISEDDQ